MKEKLTVGRIVDLGDGCCHQHGHIKLLRECLWYFEGLKPNEVTPQMRRLRDKLRLAVESEAGA